ncbi:Caffeine dehydrogenase subunit beta (plasmid) [Variovorax sp. SRS16]|uniref:FAD binding domain-containing protein n=1 Tax=Variovorax sp. SRS16 TaxID=282217 RepID=UPI001315B4C1|nr:xanthine dehydrogenase family protein subunit M [Variovorax sp. SRS16]VTU46567.1 Caffeine dehydrogenase subunit beta [Variovorax sp. SRS16]
MKPPVFDYFAPTSLDEALHLLDLHGEGARPLAGGQSLMPALNFRLAAPSALIDLNGIEALSGVRVEADGSLVAGAMTRHRFFETSPLIRERLPLVHHAMHLVAHVAVRNRGTIGGSLCYSDPSAEWPALCLACEAQMVMQGLAGVRRLPARDFLINMFATALAPDEILTEVVFPAWPPTRRWGFQEVSRRKGDFAIVGAVCVLDIDADGLCESARIVVFGATDSPVVLPEAAAELQGHRPDPDRVHRAALHARDAIECRSDLHASADYRSELVQALTTRALLQALADANASYHA